MTLNLKLRIATTAIIVVALAMMPVPILPPHRIAEMLQSLAGISWKWAYLVAAVGIRGLFYLVIGIAAAFTVTEVRTLRERMLQGVWVYALIIILAVVVRSIKAGHPPIWVNVVIPAIGCAIGVTLGLSALYRQWKIGLGLVAIGFAIAFVAMFGGTSLPLRLATEAHLQQIVERAAQLPPGEERFGSLLQAAFIRVPMDDVLSSAVQRNRASILAFGIATGHIKLARFAGLDPSSDLVRRAEAIPEGTSLRGREDWSRHFAVSASLAALENPAVSDAAGLMKEQLDALAQGSGFSFGDLAADRAGVRFAGAATETETAALVMRERLRKPVVIDEFFPAKLDLREDLTVEQFRQAYDGVGSKRYRAETEKIERMLDSCSALRPARSIQ